MAVTRLARTTPRRQSLPLRADNTAAVGMVTLVGAGPGDADLLTIKALRAIESADIILFDRLVSEDIRALFPKGTPAFYVGKAKDNHSIAQADLNDLLVAKASEGLHVVRLKGGDSFVFGRGGEEMLALKKAGVRVVVVPGITAGAGATCYAGIPLTHRGISQGCTFVTAQGETELNIDWQALVRCDHTLVFYMGLSRASMIENKLLQAGMSANMPVALIENGCCKQQRVIKGSLKELAELVVAEKVQSPALIVVGKVVELANDLQWFAEAAAPLAGQSDLTKMSA